MAFKMISLNFLDTHMRATIVPISTASSTLCTISTVAPIATGRIPSSPLTTPTTCIPSHIRTPTLPIPRIPSVTRTSSPILSTTFTPSSPTPSIPEARHRPKHILSLYGKGLFSLIIYLPFNR